MEAIITEWGLQSYLDLKAQQAFTRDDYRDTIRPDVLLLKSYPANPKFGNNKFWGPATDKAKKPIGHGFKMKWHNIGPGHIQLRVCVAINGKEALLCRAYAKDSDSTDKREMAKLKLHISAILRQRHQVRGKL